MIPLSEAEVSPGDVPDWLDEVPEVPPPKPTPNSLTASAQRLTSKQLKGGTFKKSTGTGWQEDAWDMYDIVGEQRFLASTLAGRMSQAKFFVGRLSEDGTPEPLDDDPYSNLLSSIGGSPAAFAQIISRLGINLFVAGEGWVVGIPPELVRETEGKDSAFGPAANVVRSDEELEVDGLDMEDLEWRMLSVSEISSAQDKVVLQLTDDQKLEVSAETVYPIRIWRPHPRKSWEAESPTRSSLPVLRELVGLTMHISAQVDSRLAGAGLFVVPQTASKAFKLANGLTEESEADPFAEALMQAMIEPISDRGSAAAVVPLVVTVPDEAADKFRHITFDKEFDSHARELREEAIRRLALGQDAPPELLLGSASMNHWGAWLVREDVVTTHLEPPLALISDALTHQYLRPVLLARGVPEETVDKLVVWYDVSHLITRPTRAADAERLFEKGVVKAETVRDSAGFNDTDKPDFDEEARRTVFDMIRVDPSLVVTPGIDVLVEQLTALLEGKSIPAAEGPIVVTGGNPTEVSTTVVPTSTEGDMPDTDGAAGQAPAVAAQPGTRTAPAAVTASADDLVRLKLQFDALGVGVRAGVDPADAAKRVGLEGIKFTGAVPSSLRLPPDGEDEVVPPALDEAETGEPPVAETGEEEPPAPDSDDETDLEEDETA